MMLSESGKCLTREIKLSGSLRMLQRLFVMRPLWGCAQSQELLTYLRLIFQTEMDGVIQISVAKGKDI